MKKILVTLCSLLPAFLITGCKEDGLLLNINPDGSGTIVVRSFVNDEAMKQMSGGFPGGGGGDNGGLTIEPSDPTEEAKDEVESLGKALGEVTLASGKAIKNKAGWPGYEAVYSFKDANKIKLTLSADMIMDEDLAADADADDFGGGGPEMDGGGGGGETPEYTIKFTPGNPARLEIMAIIDEAADAEAAARSDQEVEMEMKQTQMQAGMMAGMLKGMRSTIMVRVNGTVVDSNADITSAAGNNVFVLADMKMAEAMTDPGVMQMMKETKGAMPSKSINLPSVKLQNPRAPVVVTFQ